VLPDQAPLPDVASDDIIEIERALTRISHLFTRARRHDRTVTEAGVAVDRADVPLLRLLAEGGPLRPGEIATHLVVEAPQVTRQLRRLEQAGHIERVPDPADRRCQRVRLSEEGRHAVDRIRAVGRRWMSEALAEWSPQDRHTLTTLFHRMVDDFVDHAAQVHAFDHPTTTRAPVTWAQDQESAE
jgi:DNA-binding MarR family transcriptional regulator